MVVQVVTKEIITCDRCAFGKQALATETRTFALEDRYYELKLCDTHAAMFDRDLNAWVMLAEEIDNPYASQSSSTSSTFFDSGHLEEARRLRELKELAIVKERERAAAAERERAAQAKLSEHHARKVIPGAAKWTITLHAYQRMVQRGVSIFEVLQTAAQPEQTYYQPHRGEYIAIHQRGHCRIAVNEDKHAVITVIDRDTNLEQEQELAAAAAH